MNTLVQIELAVAQLPRQDQWSLLTWLQGRLTSGPGATATTPEALNVFRQLQDEVRLTPEGAAAWKDAVADARQ
jgi:hypothetical protein